MRSQEILPLRLVYWLDGLSGWLVSFLSFHPECVCVSSDAVAFFSSLPLSVLELKPYRSRWLLRNALSVFEDVEGNDAVEALKTTLGPAITVRRSFPRKSSLLKLRNPDSRFDHFIKAPHLVARAPRAPVLPRLALVRTHYRNARPEPEYLEDRQSLCSRYDRKARQRMSRSVRILGVYVDNSRFSNATLDAIPPFFSSKAWIGTRKYIFDNHVPLGNRR